MGLRLGRRIDINHRLVGGKPNGSPSSLVATVLSDTSIKCDWTNGATNQDGTYIYYCTTVDGTYILGDTVVGNGMQGNITGLTYAQTYYVKVVHYKGDKLSNYSDIVTITQWDKWYGQIFTDFKSINTHIPTATLNGLYDTTLRHLFSPTYTDSETTGYYYTTFSAKRKADFFLLFFHYSDSVARTGWIKSGAIIRHNIEDEVFNQNNAPAHVYNGKEYHVISSTDGLAGITRMDLAINNLYKDIASLHYLKTTLVRLNIYTNELSSNLTNFELPTRLGDSGSFWYRNKFTGVLNITESTAVATLSFGQSVYGNYINGLVTSSTYMGGLQYLFKNCFIDTASIDKFFADMDAYYTAHAPANNVIVDFSGFTNGFLTGYTSNANYTHLMSLFAAQSKTLTATFNDPSGKELDKGYAIFIWDDGFKNNDLAFSLLDKYNYKGAVAITGLLAETTGFYTKAEILALDAIGQEIIDHSNSHPYFTSKSEAEIRSEFTTMNAFFASIPISIPISHAYPHGSYNATIETYVDDYRSLARTVAEGYVFKNADRFALNSVNIDTIPVARGASFENDKLIIAKQYALSAKNNKLVMIFSGHSIDTTGDVYSANPNQLEELIDYVHLIGLDVIQMRDLVNILD